MIMVPNAWVPIAWLVICFAAAKIAVSTWTWHWLVGCAGTLLLNATCYTPSRLEGLQLELALI
jgi:hypothetical protein